MVSTGWTSIASNSIGRLSRTSNPKGFFTSRKRACGMATPPPIPVEPSSSRLLISLTTTPAGSFRVDAARFDSAFSTSDLSRACNLDCYVGW